MPFQLPDVTKITVTNANPRRELHGEDKVRAIDLSFVLTGENTLLDLIEPGLREHHFCNKALAAGQEVLPEVVIPLPNLRFPRLPLAYKFANGEKWRGYRLIRDYGLEEEAFDFTDVVLANLHYEITEGGTVKIFGTIQYNGDELADNDLYGMLSGLASEGDIHVKLLAPPELVSAKKGYRAGKPDTPVVAGGDDSQGELGDGDVEVDSDEPGDEEPTPESVLAASVASDTQPETSAEQKKDEPAWPFPTGRRSRKVA